MKRKYLILFSLSGLILSCDQLTKTYVHSGLMLNVRHSVIPSLFSITYSRATGLVFGSFVETSSSLREIVFIGIPTFALILIVLIFVKLQDSQIVTSLALTLIFAGAIGNLVDRIQRGFVIDFIDVHWKNSFSLPPLNLADLSIIAGVVLVFYSAIKQVKQPSGSVS